jgi:multidrug transporter EmrE-like cation transporter
MIVPVLHSFFLLAIAINEPLDINTLFAYMTGVTAFLFIMVAILIFVYIYDNMRRGRKTPVAPEA